MYGIWDFYFEVLNVSTIRCFEESVQFKVRSLLLKYGYLTKQITIFRTTFP